jgi:hypothetical protein
MEGSECRADSTRKQAIKVFIEKYPGFWINSRKKQQCCLQSRANPINLLLRPGLHQIISITTSYIISTNFEVQIYSTLSCAAEKQHAVQCVFLNWILP